MKIRRLSYNDAFGIVFRALKVTDKAKGLFWLIAIIFVMVGIFDETVDFVLGSKLMGSIVTSLAMFILAYLSAGTFNVSREWKENGAKNFDGLFLFFSSRKRFFKYFAYAFFIAMIYGLHDYFFSKKDIPNPTLIESLLMVIDAVALVILNKLIIMASFLRSFDGISFGKSFKLSIIGLLKSIDTLIVYAIWTSFALILMVALTLGVMLIFIVPAAMFMEYLLYRQLFFREDVSSSL